MSASVSAASRTTFGLVGPGGAVRTGLQGHCQSGADAWPLRACVGRPATWRGLSLFLSPRAAAPVLTGTGSGWACPKNTGSRVVQKGRARGQTEPLACEPPKLNLRHSGAVALCALPNRSALQKAWHPSRLLGRAERKMANPAQEARERLEARFRKQYEADRTAEKQRAERDIRASRSRDTEPTKKTERLTRRAADRVAGTESRAISAKAASGGRPHPRDLAGCCHHGRDCWRSCLRSL